MVSQNRLSGYFVAVLAGFMFGSIPIFSALLRDIGASSVEQTFIRLFIGGIWGGGFLLFFLVRNHDMVLASLQRQVPYIIQGFLFTLSIVAYLSAIALQTPIGEAALLVQVHPFVTLLFGALLLKERMTRSKLLALGLAFIGIIVLTRPWEWDSFLSSIGGDLLAVFNGSMYALYLLVGAYSSESRRNIPPALSISWVLVWGFLTSLPLLILLSFLPLPPELSTFSIDTLLTIDFLVLGLGLAFFGSILPYGLIMLSNTFNVEASRQSILLLGEPISAILLGLIVLSEPITPWYLVGGFALICSIILVTLSVEEPIRMGS
ncbi:MAG: DMT family transporter [Candidatus Heimdallarchaeota archaeon]